MNASEPEIEVAAKATRRRFKVECVLGLGRAHFPFGLNVARWTRARHPVRMTRHQGRDGGAAASASRFSRRRSFFFMPTT